MQMDLDMVSAMLVVVGSVTGLMCAGACLARASADGVAACAEQPEVDPEAETVAVPPWDLCDDVPLTANATEQLRSLGDLAAAPTPCAGCGGILTTDETVRMRRLPDGRLEAWHQRCWHQRGQAGDATPRVEHRGCDCGALIGANGLHTLVFVTSSRRVYTLTAPQAAQRLHLDERQAPWN